jgi:hypothetical protein
MTAPVSPAGTCVRGDVQDSEFWASVPDPLPPRLDFSENLVQALVSATHAVGELSGLGRTLPDPHLLIRPFIDREAVLSSRIEGTEATVTDLYAYRLAQRSLPTMEVHPQRSDV